MAPDTARLRGRLPYTFSTTYCNLPTCLLLLKVHEGLCAVYEKAAKEEEQQGFGLQQQQWPPQPQHGGPPAYTHLQ